MSRELWASLRIVAHVARADARLCSEELLALDALAERHGAVSRLPLLDDRTDLETLLRAVVSPELRRSTLVGAVAVANIDGRCSPDERAVLEAILRAFDADAWIDLAAESAAWRRRTGTIRRALEGATVAYLHEVHEAATREELSMERYERLVAGLAEAKKELERAFLDAVDAAIERVARAAGLE